MILLACTLTVAAMGFAPAFALPDNACNTRDSANMAAELFIRGDETFAFDGLAETLAIEDMGPSRHAAGVGMMLTLGLPVDGGRHTVRAKFDCRHSGYGDRAGKFLAQAITPHEARITLVDCRVVEATLDGKWDMLAERAVS